MKLPFWRCATILLLLWALPAQWLAAATAVQCAGHTSATVRTESAATLAPTHHSAPQKPQQPQQPQPHGAHVAEHHSGPTAEHAHDLLSVVPHGAGADLAQDGASAHPQAKCGDTGHCCLSAALLATTLADFAQGPVSMDYAPVTQHHHAPVLSGPDRPPQVRAA